MIVLESNIQNVLRKKYLNELNERKSKTAFFFCYILDEDLL